MDRPHEYAEVDIYFSTPTPQMLVGAGVEKKMSSIWNQFMQHSLAGLNRSRVAGFHPLGDKTRFTEQPARRGCFGCCISSSARPTASAWAFAW